MTSFTTALSAHTALQTRIKHSSFFLKEVQEAAAALPCGGLKEVCVFAAGSLGRFETGRKSDLDVFLLCHRDKSDQGQRSVTRLREIEVFADLIRLNENLNLPPFSGDGKFLKIHELKDLIAATGDSSRDDSENLFTTRLLLLLESKPITNRALYQDALKQVVEHYFRDGKGRRDFHPLFLLNDVLRYWRTLCLNYERDRTLEKPWWKKNLNLKFSRKLTVFSTVLALLSERIKTPQDFLAFAELVPLERLAWALDQIDDPSLLSGFVRLLDDYESFLAAKSYASLERKDVYVLDDFRQKAQHFGDFLYDAVTSSKLKKSLIRYVAI